MPDQLHDDIEHVRPLLKRCLDEVADLRDAFRRDRWWRRVGKVMVILAFVTAGLAWAYDDHQRCLRGNATRLDTRAAIHAALLDALTTGDTPASEVEQRLESNDRAVVEALPLRSCRFG